MTAVLHEPGIYFGMPADEYHADPALGSSALRAIALDPYEWQYGRLKGEEKDTAALLWGDALHVRTLEGPEAFRRKFAVKPDIADYPGALDTMDDLRKHAGQLGVKPGRSKDEAIAAIREFDRQTPIWGEIMAAFLADSAGKTLIGPKFAAEIEQAAEWMQADPKLAPLMKNGTFVEGAAEVSIFYEEAGVRLKARIDRVLQHAVIDLKSFRPPVGWNTHPAVINRSLAKVIGQNRYEFQAAAYLKALDVARGHHAAGRVSGAGDLGAALLNAAMNRASLSWTWIFVKNTGAPEPIVREFPSTLDVFRAGRQEIERAIDTYRQLRDEFGDDVVWPPRHAADRFSNEDFPAWYGM